MLEVLAEIVVRLVCLILSDLVKAEPPRFQEFTATSFHEPHLEFWVSRKRVGSEWLGLASDVIRSENWLFEAFVKHQG